LKENIKIFIYIYAVVQAVKSMAYLVVGENTGVIFSKFGAFWRTLTSESQLRWVMLDTKKFVD